MTSAFRIAYPVHYDIPTAIGQVAASDEFKALARARGDITAQLAEELTRVAKAEHDAELAAFHRHIAEVTLARLKDRLDKQSKSEEARRAIDAARKHDLSTGYMPMPADYKLVDHMESIRTSPEFRSVAQGHGYLPEMDSVRALLHNELKQTLADNQAAHLAAFTKHVGDRAFGDLKLKLATTKR
jgi:hypothetical protein